MYVSSGQGGTAPYRSLKAKEFHEMYWSQDWGRRGTLVEERSIDISEFKRSCETKVEGAECENTEPLAHTTRGRRRLVSFRTKFHALSAKTDIGCTSRRLKSDSNSATRPISTISSQDISHRQSVQPSHQWQIPNAIFARKFGLFTDSDPLPPSIKESPIAESKVVNSLALDLSPDFAQYCSDQGQLTPQLWYDGGLDFRWRRMSWSVPES